MNDRRTPRDGKPFYCKTCGLGIGEYYACEEVDCELESEEDAKARVEKISTDTAAKTIQNGGNQ